MGRYWLFILLSAALISSCNSDKPKFERIVFHQSICLGDCDAYHLEINRDTSVRIFGEDVYQNTGKFDYRSAVDKEGYFIGKARSADFKKLDSIIQHIGIDTLKFDPVTCCDAPVYTIIVYFDHKKVVLKSMNPPEKANELIGVLETICRNSDVRRTLDPFVLEGQKEHGF